MNFSEGRQGGCGHTPALPPNPPLPLIITHYDISYPQNGDRIVTIDPVTSLHPVYTREARTALKAVDFRGETAAAVAENG